MDTLGKWLAVHDAMLTDVYNLLSFFCLSCHCCSTKDADRHEQIQETSSSFSSCISQTSKLCYDTCSYIIWLLWYILWCIKYIHFSTAFIFAKDILQIITDKIVVVTN